MNWSEVNAVFGGSFDPPHEGHLQALKGIQENPGVKRLILLPNGRPPGKSPIANIEDRKNMVEALIQGQFANEEVIIDHSELSTGEIHYSFETIQALNQEYPNLAFVIGTDQLESLDRWHRFPELLDLCHWIILERKGSDSKEARSRLQQFEASSLIKSDLDHWVAKSGKILVVVPTSAPEISSSAIRATYQKGEIPPPNLLPQSVSDYLEEHSIY